MWVRSGENETLGVTRFSTAQLVQVRSSATGRVAGSSRTNAARARRPAAVSSSSWRAVGPASVSAARIAWRRDVSTGPPPAVSYRAADSG